MSCSSNRETGYLELKSPELHTDKWTRKWFVFEDGVLSYADEPMSSKDEYRTISMEKVISLRADVSPLSLLSL
jgi:hypothetical protein